MRDGCIRGGDGCQLVRGSKFDCLGQCHIIEKFDTLGEQAISFLSLDRYLSKINWSSFESGRGNREENVLANVSGEYM